MLELEEMKREQTTYQQQIEAVDEAIKNYQGQIDSMAAGVAKKKVKYDFLRAD